MYLDTLLSLLTDSPWDTSDEILVALLGAIGSVQDSQSAASDALVKNFSPYTADINGIVLWEQAFDLPSDNSLSLSDRQQRAAAKAFRLNGALTAEKYTNLFNLFSATKSATFSAVPSQYLVYGNFKIDDMRDYDTSLRYILNSIPAHIEFRPTFTTTIQDAEMTPAGSTIISVNGTSFLNNNKVGALDGSWKLDGTSTLSSTASPAPAVTSSAVISVNSIFTYGQVPEVRGFVLDGNRKLDGTWDLSGATSAILGPIGYTVTVNGVAV